MDAAVHDWSVFWYETAAEYINGLARMFKRYDPTRPTITYLTMSWAFPAEWDETQRSAIAPDEVAMHGRDIDGFGMQLCAADGDPFRITACLDLVRKYGKPMWTVDLVDFTSGVHIGYPAMDRITQSAVQHGTAGIIYCAWHIPTVLDYSFYPNMALDDTHRMLSHAHRAVGIMAGLQVHARGAILQPILPATPSDPEGFKNDYRSFMGWYKLLESLYETFDVVTLREIEKRRVDLSSYRYVLVPDCSCLPEAAWERLAAYHGAGGLLITVGRFAERDAIGRPLAQRPVAQVALPDYGKAYAGDPIRDTHAGNTPPLFLWREETDATRRAFRQGQDTLRSCLTTAGLAPLVELVPNDTSIRCVEWSGPDVHAVYLVNMSDEPMAAGSLKLHSCASRWHEQKSMRTRVWLRTAGIASTRSTCPPLGVAASSRCGLVAGSPAHMQWVDWYHVLLDPNAPPNFHGLPNSHVPPISWSGRQLISGRLRRDHVVDVGRHHGQDRCGHRSTPEYPGSGNGRPALGCHRMHGQHDHPESADGSARGRGNAFHARLRHKLHLCSQSGQHPDRSLRTRPSLQFQYRSPARLVAQTKLSDAVAAGGLYDRICREVRCR